MVVYPRWRGELDRTASVVSSGSGLSPLARGTPVFANLWTIAIRFIPAGAGNTYKTRTHPPRGAVYPRWRGEHTPAALDLKKGRGEHSKHNLLLINDFLSQSQSTNFIVSHKQHIHYVKEHLIH